MKSGSCSFCTIILLTVLSSCSVQQTPSEASALSADEAITASDSSAIDANKDDSGNVSEAPNPDARAANEATNSRCPSDKQAAQLLPGVKESDLDPQTWTTKSGNQVILNSGDIQKFNERFYDKWSDLDARLTVGEIRTNMRERLDSYRQKFEDKEIMFEDGTLPNLSDFDNRFQEFLKDWPDESAFPAAKQYIFIEDTAILCGPHDRPYIKTQDGEIRFSRNQCSLGRSQSRVEIIYTHPDGMRFVRTGDMWGWLPMNARLSPEIQSNSKHCIRPLSDAQNYSEKLEDGHWFTWKELQIAGQTIPKGAALAGNSKSILIAKADGFEEVSVSNLDKSDITDTHRTLTWNNWVNTLFKFLDDPYGWGGYGGNRDCSSLLQDAARSFGLHLARNSAHQITKTSYYLNVDGMAPEDKIKTIEDAAQTGIVLLYFKGHIMAYLGRSDDGRPMVLHALSEYLEACPGEDPSDPSQDQKMTMVHTDRVVVSDLSLSEGSPRGNYLERISHIAVITDISGSHKKDKSKGWTPQDETLYAAFIERLFDYEDISRSWNNLGDILRDKEHNILYNSMGMNEESKLKLKPDCADLPYALRSYFAWKRGLPMGVRKCSRGTDSKPPKCKAPEITVNKNDPADVYQKYVLILMGYKVHSGNARTAHNDDETDMYPIELTRHSLRSGISYADPHGHLLMIAHYAPDTKETPGALYSVDAQPDGTITRKRFWRGNFLFAPEMKSVGQGFKAFRPIVCTSLDEANCRQLTNAELNESSGFIPYSDEQSKSDANHFYDRVEIAIHPKPLSIEESVNELTDALFESANRRLENVQNGDDYIRENGAAHMIMPEGYAVFETTGPWESFATPSRDMRLLVAIDAVNGFPDSIVRNADRYGYTHDEAVTVSEEARKKIDERLETLSVEYLNSKGKPVKLNMLELKNRVENMEMAYHPADCNEIRWGAPEGSEEIKTCSRRASAAEHQKLLNMRKWFHLRSRPPR